MKMSLKETKANKERQVKFWLKDNQFISLARIELFMYHTSTQLSLFEIRYAKFASFPSKIWAYDFSK